MIAAIKSDCFFLENRIRQWFIINTLLPDLSDFYNPVYSGSEIHNSRNG